MGKIKRQRQRRARFNPIGIGLSEEVANNGVEESLEGRQTSSSSEVSTAGLKAIDEKLSSVIVEERLSGLNTLAALALDDHTGVAIVNSNVLRKVSRLLKDPSSEVRLVAAGALRNVSASGSDDVVEAMVQQDILSPLADLLQEYQNEWSPSMTALGQPASREEDLMTNIFVHATYCLLNLCECSEEALRVFNQEGLVPVLLRHLDPSTWGHTLALAAAECLLCVSENNPNAQTVLLPAADPLVLFISRPTDSAVDLHFAATIAGLLMNIDYCASNGSNFQLILQLLSTVLEADAVKLTEELAARLPSTNGNNLPVNAQDLEHLISAQQLTLEIISNICCSDDDEDWDDCGVPSDNEAEKQDEYGENGGEVESMDTGNKSELSPEIQEGIAHFSLFQKSLRKVQYPEDSTCQTLQSTKYGPSILSKLTTLQVRALLSLQNMISALGLSEIGGSDLMYSTWVDLGNMVFKNPCLAENMLEAATGAMRAIMEKLSQGKCEKLSSITHEDLKIVLESGVSCTTPSVRANLTRMVGTLGYLLVSQHTEESLYNDQRSAVLAAITEFLIKVASHDNELWVSAEALDVIIDLYSDDKTDRLASMTYLVDSLKGIQPNFKSRYQKQKKKLGDHRPLVLTVRDNLTAFIKYKAPRAAKHRNI